MKLKATSIICLLAMMMISCQNDLSNELAVNEDGTVPVKVSLSMLSGINYDTGYEPMTRADGLPLAYVSRVYGVLICKKIENRWVVEKFILNNFPKSNMKIYDEDVFQSFTTELRPGDYRMTVITGVGSMAINQDLQPGKTVQVEGEKPLLAFTYLVEKEGFLNPGAPTLSEEIFAGNAGFKVAKTEELDSISLIKNVHVELERKVTKLRVFLKKEYEGISWKVTDIEPGLSASIKMRDDGTAKFVNGLDVWGDIYYDDNNPLTLMKYGVYSPNIYERSPVDDEEYLAPGLGTRQHNMYYFSDPANPYEVEISDINITYRSGNSEHSYAKPEDGAYEPPIKIDLKHNTQHGLAFAPGNTYHGEFGVDIFSMILMLNADGTTDKTELFPLTFEYR